MKRNFEWKNRFREARNGYRALSAVIVLGLFGSLLIIWTHRIGQGQGKVFAWVNAATDIRVHTAMFRVWFEKALSGMRRDDVRKTFTYLDNAIALSDAVLAGGTSEHGTRVPPLDDPSLRSHIEDARSHLAALKEISLKRQQHPESSGVGSLLSDQFDAAFLRFDNEARTLELLAERKWARAQATSGRLHVSFLATWFVVVAGAATGFFRGERRRGEAEAALERAYIEMEQTVTARTAELSEANRNLREEVAERTQAQMSLTRSEAEYRRLSAHLRTLLDTIPDSITLMSPELRVIWANRGAAVPSLSEPVGRYCHDLHHGRSTPCGDCPALKSLRSGRLESARIVSPEGRHLDLRAVPVVKEGGALEGVIEVASDVTDAVNLQAKTVRAAHLASLGELAAGVAHEINNPVNGVISCGEILVNKSEIGSREHDIGGRILKEGGRIASIVKSLLSFAREETEEKTPSRVAEILADSIALTEALIRREGIAVIVDVPDDISVLAHPQQLEQVFLNIINNARYALSRKYPGAHEEKVIRITAREVGVDDRRAVRISFRDQGTGIPAHTIGRVFDPFFSTKPKGDGTGLGLSISHGIVVAHGGTLAIDSVEGAFTDVLIELPLLEKI